MTDIDVSCQPTDGGWRCAVTLTDGARQTFEVSVSQGDAERLAAARDGADVERLVDETFAFLLEREPASSILRSFDLLVVGRYFPEFESEIAHRCLP